MCLKLSRYKNHSIFNLCFMKLGLVPKALRVPCMVRTIEEMHIADRASHAIVGERLHVTERPKRDLVNDKKWLEIGLERRIGR